MAVYEAQANMRGWMENKILSLLYIFTLKGVVMRCNLHKRNWPIILFHLNISFYLVILCFYAFVITSKHNETTMRQIQFLILSYSIWKNAHGFWFYNSTIIEVVRSFASRGKSKPIKTHVEQYNYRPYFACDRFPNLNNFLTLSILTLNILDHKIERRIFCQILSFHIKTRRISQEQSHKRHVILTIHPIICIWWKGAGSPWDILFEMRSYENQS